MIQCSFKEGISHPDGSFTSTVCIQEAKILIVNDPCFGLCYACAYNKVKAENVKLKEEKSKAYMAANRTSTVFFESRDDAEKYAGKGGATSGIEVTEITILPKGSVI